MGSGSPILLLHGAGAATHSWRDVAPRLAETFTVIAPDLPGHGFTQTPRPQGLSLPGMARGLKALMAELDLSPRAAVGHSAGAAVALRLGLDGMAFTDGVVSLNGALRPFPGAAGAIFPALARLLFLNPLAIQAFAWRARGKDAVSRLIESTGSHIDPAGLDFYQRLMRTTGHIDGALGMMAHWDLQALQEEMSRFSFPLTLVAADGDRAVPPEVAREAQARMPQATVVPMVGLGHLAHEEAPDQVAKIVREALSRPEQPA